MASYIEFLRNGRKTSRIIYEGLIVKHAYQHKKVSNFYATLYRVIQKSGCTCNNSNCSKWEAIQKSLCTHALRWHTWIAIQVSAWPSRTHATITVRSISCSYRCTGNFELPCTFKFRQRSKIDLHCWFRTPSHVHACFFVWAQRFGNSSNIHTFSNLFI